MSLTVGIKLEKLLKGTPMGIIPFIHIAMAMTKLVQTAHNRNTIIGDLNPTGIQIQSDMNLAVLAENRITNYAYQAPEQIGRINRAPDERSDLYALGMMFYEMLTGRSPFQAESMEEWVHAHLAIKPSPLSLLHPELAGSLEDMMMKLLSKSPDDRYQSAYGLLFDLKRCASSLEQGGEIIAFEIALADEASRFRLPRTLFGLETEMEALREVLNQIRTGASAFVFVSGRAGSGKSALIQELQAPVIRDGGRFIAGKCDFLNRDIPFEPILQALRRLIRQIWSESPESVAKLKIQLTVNLGSGAGVITQLLPEAAMLLGDFPAVASLPPAEAAIRFRRMLPIFMKVFADSRHPLVLFLDDLQWADPATLDILRTFAQGSPLHGLLVIGTFRVEEIPRIGSEEAQAEAAAWIEQVLSLNKAETTLQVQHIALNPLTYIDVRRFVSDILHENTARVRMLAESLYHRTGGNPLYLHRLLGTLYREKKLVYDEEQAIWTWDAAVMNQMPDDPDIIHMIGSRIRMLPQETIDLLALAAAIGHRFQLGTLALVSGISLPDLLISIHSAEEEALICRENDDADGAETDEGYYTFLHDRVQQAAYQAIPESDKAALHLKIGQAMLSHGFDQKEESIFEIVYHLNLGRSEMVDEVEKQQLAAYNLQAGLKSKASTAFVPALHFLRTGLQLIGDDEKGTDSLAYRIMLEMPECEYMSGNIDRAEELLDQLMDHTTDLVERSRIYLIQIAMNAYLKRNNIVVNIGRLALAELGWQLPIKPSKAAIIKEVALTRISLYRMRKVLPQLPLNHDPQYTALSDLVLAISPRLFTISLELSAVLFSRYVRYGLKHGNNEAFTLMLCIYGSIFVSRFRRFIPGYKVGFQITETAYTETAYLLSNSFDRISLQSQLHLYMGLFKQYRNPKSAEEHFEQSVRYGLEAGDLTFVGHSMHTNITTHRGDLHTLSARIANYEENSRWLLDEDTLQIFRIARWYISELNGLGGDFDEISIPMDGNSLNQIHNNQAFYTCTCRIEIAYLTGQYREALRWVELGKFNSFAQTELQIHKQHVYHLLTQAALYSDAQPEECKRIRRLLKKQLRYMARAVGFFGKESSAYLLITAELARIDGNRVAAIQGFEDAIRTARSDGYEIMEAIACERAAISYREMGMTAAADALLTEACSVYSRWGAAVKVRNLREAYPELPLLNMGRLEDRIAVTQEAGQDGAARGMTPYSVEEEGLIQQISAWSITSDNQGVMNRILDSALRYSGAEKGYVLDSKEEGICISAQAGGKEDTSEDHSYSEAIVRYVVNSGEPVVLANASHSSYAADDYIRRYQPQSVLCMPVLIPGKSLPSVLYLENNLISGVFMEMRLEVLELMITRMIYLKLLEDSREQISVSSHSSNDVVDRLTHAVQPLVNSLTNRETEILYALSDGLTNKEIAYRFGLTEPTVKTHLTNLYGKLGVNRRLQAIAQARELKLLE